MKRWTILFCLLTQWGCAAIDRPAMTTFEPFHNPTPGGFKYRARADALHREDSSSAEAERMRWVEMYLEDNKHCPRGYEISERKTSVIQTGMFGAVLDIFYSGRCRP